MKEKQKISTKQKILDVSIDLFAQNGFKEISVREIAKAVGIKASSLYKHYESKEEILASIFALFKERMERTEFPKEQLKQYVLTVTPEEYLNESFKMFKQVMWDPVVVKIAKIITVEQRHHQTVRDFFISELIEKPNRLLQYVFDIMVEEGCIPPINTRVLAEEYSAYIISLYFEQNFLKDSLNLDEIESKMKQHNDFYVYNILKKGKEE